MVIQNTLIIILTVHGSIVPSVDNPFPFYPKSPVFTFYGYYHQLYSTIFTFALFRTFEKEMVEYNVQIARENIIKIEQ